MGGLARARRRIMRAGGPPRARLCFRVGVVGHRPNRLPTDHHRLDQLRQTLHALLKEVRETVGTIAASHKAAHYTAEAPILRAISPLAEGSDRIFAHEALALGYELTCPMPFLQKEFEKDFAPGAALTPESLAQFEALLAQADAAGGLILFEMDGARATAPEAYGAAGRIVLNQVDLLIAVWDGGEPAGVGGTVQTLREALQFRVPVIWIDPAKPAAWRLLHGLDDLAQPHGAAASLHDTINAVVEAELALPSQDERDRGSRAPDFFAERKPVINLNFAWKAFRDLITFTPSASWMLIPQDFEKQIAPEWPLIGEPGAAATPVADWINSRLRRHFAWADGLANYYADAHRSAFVLSYLLSAAAVCTALLPMATGSDKPRPGEIHEWLEVFCTVAELLILTGVFGLLGWGRFRRWHERWTEYRLLAELIRQLRFLVPLGGGKPLPRMPAHMAVYGDPARTWMYWHVRAIAREIGIPGARVTQDYKRDCLAFLAQMVGDKNSGQWGFHRSAERRAHRLSHRLHILSLALVGATMLGVGLRLAAEVLHFSLVAGHIDWGRWLVLGAAFLPALAAAMEGINNQGEFVRVAKRSAAMAGIFEKYARKIAALELAPPLHLADLTPLSSNIAETMVDEVVDWRAVIIDRE
jgi:hypothetical protein